MELNIPKEKAIQILEKRKSEIDEYGFEPKVWKHTTEDNLKEIFGALDFKWTQISGISFNSPFTELGASMLAKGKLQAKKYLDSYIEQINEFTDIKNSIVEENERFFEEENKTLKSKLMDVVSSTNSILEDRNKLLSDINEKSIEIKSLKENTVQLNEITLNKLVGLIKNLPIGQTIGLFTTLFGVIGFSFWLGTSIKENSFLKTEYELQTKINKLNSDKEKLGNDIFKLENKNTNLEQEIKKLNNKKEAKPTNK